MTRLWTFTVTEHDPAKPWLVIGPSENHEVELDEAQSFFAWAAEQWPSERFTVELDPWQLGPGLLR